MDVIKPRNPQYVAVLAVAASLILVGGWFARPRQIPESVAPVPTETELEQLARRAERRSLDSMAKYFAGVARDVESSMVYVRGARESGVAWDETRIVTAPLQRELLAAPVSVSAGGADAAGTPAVSGPNLPLAALAVSPGAAGLTPVRRVEAMPQAGDWLVAVWRTETTPAFAVGNFRQAVPMTCALTPVQEIVSSLSLTSTMVGGGLFDIDGSLVAVVLPCQDRLTAVAAASVQAILDRANTIEQRLRSRYGIAVDAMSAEEASHFKVADGLIVREVWSDHAADVAGLRPGDIITAAGGNAVTKTEDLSALMPPAGAPVDLTVLRGSKKLTLPLSDAQASGSGSDQTGVGLQMESPPSTYRIASVRPGSRAARAGIQAGDHLVRIDQAEPRSLSQVERIIDGAAQRPMWLEVVRDRRRLGFLLQ